MSEPYLIGATKFLRALLFSLASLIGVNSACACISVADADAEICPPSADWSAMATRGEPSTVTLELTESSGVTRQVFLTIEQNPQYLTMMEDEWAELENAYSAVNVAMLVSRHEGALILRKGVHERFGFGAATVSTEMRQGGMTVIATSTMGFPQRALLFLETARIGEDIVAQPEDDVFHETVLGWLRIGGEPVI